MCMSTPDMPEMIQPEPAKPPPPPKPPAPPAPPASKGAVDEQGAPEGAAEAVGTTKRRDRSSLRIPKNRSKGVNLPGSNRSGGDS